MCLPAFLAMRLLSFVLDPHANYVPLAYANNQAVSDRNVGGRIGNLLPIGPDGDRSAFDVTTRFVVSFCEPAQDKQPANPNLGVLQFRRWNLHFTNVRGILIFGE